MTVAQVGQKKKRFLGAFRKTGIISAACRAAKVPRSDVYSWQERDERFLHDFRQAEIESTELLEAEAFRRAHGGTLKPVYQGKELVGKVREYSDTLLMFILKGRKPEKYREPVRGDAGAGDQAARPQLVNLSGLSDEELDALTRIIEKTGL